MRGEKQEKSKGFNGLPATSVHCHKITDDDTHSSEQRKCIHRYSIIFAVPKAEKVYKGWKSVTWCHIYQLFLARPFHRM